MSIGKVAADFVWRIGERIRNRPKAVARRARKQARKAASNPPDEVTEPFFNVEDQPMNWTLLIALAGSFLRHFTPWATALLAGYGIEVSPEASPWVTLGVALGVYLVMQAISFVRQWQKHRT